MRDRSRTAARLALASLIVLATSVMLSVPAALARTRPTGSCVVKVTTFVFHPHRVHSGDRAELRLAARNCTDQTLHLIETEYGKRIPPCPTVDPIGHQVTIRPFGWYRPRPLIMVAPPCSGVEVMVVTFQDLHGSMLAKRTATLHITDPGP